VDLPAYLRKPIWKELPGTQLEVERIAQSYRKTFATGRALSLLTRGEADATRLKRELTPAAGTPRWRYLHLATHGFSEPPAPQAPAREPADTLLTFDTERQHRTFGRNPLLLSGLVLSGANRDPDHGILTAEEVADLDLRGTDLVVLSACDTGLGKVAGARALAVSLWSVHDAATSVLMEELYANLWRKKLPRLQALRQAQLTVLRDPDRVTRRVAELREMLLKRGVPEEVLAARGIGKVAEDLPGGGTTAPAGRRSPPAWWAAFVLSGEPGELTKASPAPAPSR
jgi:CHAT domain-containing protein